ncbi:hypothetical protein LO762_29250 [Actinocorallia sp. API 0066]|uniref:hypothetical protein n=1 Tax=Actinocorallia sp. API 0066 TaxID=2896846 RepID=UPI001E335CCF|nr:hypothetical protein [Actinocorallia sp. API 0066]MCD0453237.1 hypothetical protein [Actinocorallia sp. API 0066]
MDLPLEFIGTDPGSEEGQSPTVFIDRPKREIVIQSWIADAETVEAVEALFRPVPGHETVIRVPDRMIPALRRALDELEGLDGVGEASSAAGA